MAKYPKPKILLVDMPEGCGELLTSEGYTASEGTFGRSCKVSGDSHDNRYVVPANGFLPNVTEQEIIIIDMIMPNLNEQYLGEPIYLGKHPLISEATPQGAISPRGFTAYVARTSFDRIIEHGGCFVVFSINAVEYEYRISDEYGHFQRLSVTNNQLLSGLASVWSSADHGEEIYPVELGTDLFEPIMEDILNAEFSCTFSPPYSLRESCLTIARNKYAQTVAMLISPDKEEKRNGWVLLLPQVRDKASLILKLLKEVIPVLSPSLFPHIEKVRWVDSREYELPHVAELREQIRLVQEEAEVKSAAIKKEIDAEREATSYLRDLISGTGDVLVDAVIVALQKFGFTQVVKGDDALDPSNPTLFKKEDLQIHDISPLLLVEVKGIAGSMIRDASALQVAKYIAPRMREWGRTDLHGLGIINHQRNVPPLDRSETPFRDDLITNAEQQGFGLMTAWDLYKLVRNFLKHDWKPEQVKPLFYRSGWIHPVPIHYTRIGTVEEFWDKIMVVGIRLHDGQLSKGDRVAFTLPIEYEEQDAPEIQVDRQSVEVAQVGELVGVKTETTKKQLRKGTVVYRAERRISA